MLPNQVVEDGYEFFAKRQLVTVFSAPNYCGEFDNAGAMMSVDDTLMVSCTQHSARVCARHPVLCSQHEQIKRKPTRVAASRYGRSAPFRFSSLPRSATDLLLRLAAAARLPRPLRRRPKSKNHEVECDAQLHSWLTSRSRLPSPRSGFSAMSSVQARGVRRRGGSRVALVTKRNASIGCCSQCYVVKSTQMCLYAWCN